MTDSLPLGKLRPVVGHSCVVGEQAARRGDCDGKRSNALRRRKDGDDRVFLPRFLGNAAAIAAPQVDDFFAVAKDGAGGSDLLTAGHAAAKNVG